MWMRLFNVMYEPGDKQYFPTRCDGISIGSPDFGNIVAVVMLRQIKQNDIFAGKVIRQQFVDREPKSRLRAN
jgi:hypothetical protein